MFKKTLIIFFLFFLFPTQSVFAVTITVNNYPSTISTESFMIGVSISKEAKTGTNYLRADLFKEGTFNYFGETYNRKIWYSGSDGQQYFPVSVTLGATTSATLQARVGNPKASDFPGPGQYKLRVRRYTSSGSAASGDVQNPVTVNIAVSTPTPSPSQSSTPVSTSSTEVTPTTVEQASSPSPIGEGTAASITPNPTVISINLFDSLKATSSSKSVLPIATKASSFNPSEKPKETKLLADKGINISKILIGLGIIIIISSAGIFLRNYKQNG